jgi:DNA polymerase III psi subunit
MINSRQQAYLDAMDIGVWCLRETPSIKTCVPASQPGLKLGPGGGGVLLVCAADNHSASRLANDISRTLGSVPVWAWPSSDSNAAKLADAVEENLFTTVAIFGKDLAGQFLEGDLPVSLGSAKLVLLPAMDDIQDHADAKRALWTTLCHTGLVTN